jgi:hypothetical protein
MSWTALHPAGIFAGQCGEEDTTSIAEMAVVAQIGCRPSSRAMEMEYGCSVETEKCVSERVLFIARATEQMIAERLVAGELSNIDILVRYVPIIMNPEWAKHYPSRTKVSHKHRVLDCAPQLNFEKFSDGPLDGAAKEYVSGIIDCLPLLAKLKFSSSEIGQVGEFFDRVAADLQAQLHDMT